MGKLVFVVLLAAKPLSAPSLRELAKIGTSEPIFDWGSVVFTMGHSLRHALWRATSLREGGKGAPAPLRQTEIWLQNASKKDAQVCVLSLSKNPYFHYAKVGVSTYPGQNTSNI